MRHMKKKHACAILTTAVFPIVLAVVFVGSGCGAKADDEPTKYRSQEGLERLTAQAQAKQAQATQDNPSFLLAKNVTPATPTGKDIDAIVRPVLKGMFKDARLVKATGLEAPKVDGEVVEDRLVYTVKAVMSMPDGDKLHGAFRAAGFSTSPRLGSKPTHLRLRGQVLMSLFESTPLRGYSFVIMMDTKTQQIEVESYMLGSRYDRLM